MRSVRILGIILGVLLLVTACGDSGGAPADDETAAGGGGTEASDTAAGGEPATIDLGISVSKPDADLFPYTAAEELGYFEDENLTVNVVPTGGSGDLIEQLAAGNVTVGTPNMLTLMQALGTGDLDLRNYYGIAYGTNFGVFVKEDSDIQSIADLEGANVGVTEPGGGEFSMLRAALGDAGLTIDDVRTIPIGAGDAATLNAIENDKVEAYAASYQDIFAVQVAGLPLRDVTPNLFGDKPQRGLIVSPDVLESEQDALIRLARAWAKATLFCQTNPDACAEFQREADPETWRENEEGLSIGGLQYEGSLPNISVPEGEQFGRLYVDAYKELSEEFERTVEGFEPVDVEEFLVDDYLDEINDFDKEAVIEEAETFSE